MYYKEEQLRVTNTCKRCGNLFEAKRKNKLYCDDCHKIIQKERVNQYRKEHKKEIIENKFIRKLRIPKYIMNDLLAARDLELKRREKILEFELWLNLFFPEGFDLNVLRNKLDEKSTDELAKIEDGGEFDISDIEKVINIWYREEKKSQIENSINLSQTEKRDIEILELRETMTYREISNKFGISKQRVQQICSRSSFEE